jgi:hypothetical protein
MNRIIPVPLPGPLPASVRRAPCWRCPATHFDLDPEAADQLDTTDRNELKDAIYCCAWTTGVICRGVVSRVNDVLADLGESPVDDEEAVTHCATRPN